MVLRMKVLAMLLVLISDPWNYETVHTCANFRRCTVLQAYSQGILLKSGNKFPTKKFLHRYVCLGAYKHVSKDLIPIPLGEPVRNVYILKLMYFQW